MIGSVLFIHDGRQCADVQALAGFDQIAAADANADQAEQGRGVVHAHRR